MRRLVRMFDAVAGGFAVGERAWQGDTMKAVVLGLTLAVPLLWKRRLASLALAGAVAVISYYLAEELHEHEITVEAIDARARASLN